MRNSLSNSRRCWRLCDAHTFRPSPQRRKDAFWLPLPGTTHRHWEGRPLYICLKSARRYWAWYCPDLRKDIFSLSKSRVISTGQCRQRRRRKTVPHKLSSQPSFTSGSEKNASILYGHRVGWTSSLNRVRVNVCRDSSHISSSVFPCQCRHTTCVASCWNCTGCSPSCRRLTIVSRMSARKAGDTFQSISTSQSSK